MITSAWPRGCVGVRRPIRARGGIPCGAAGWQVRSEWSRPINGRVTATSGGVWCVLTGSSGLLKVNREGGEGGGGSLYGIMFLWHGPI